MPQVPHARRIPCYWALTLIGWTRGLSFRIIVPGRVALRALWRTPTQTDHWAHPFERSLNPHLNDLIMAPLRAPPFAHWKLNMSLDVQWTSQWARAHLEMVLGGREGRPPATGLHLYLHPPPSLGFLPKVTTDDRSPAAAHTERWRSARTGYSRQGFSAHPSHRLGGRPPLPP